MNQYNFDEIIDRRHTNSAKFDEMDALFGSDVMHLGISTASVTPISGFITK